MSENALWNQLVRCVVNKVPFEGSVSAAEFAELEEVRKQLDFNAHMSDDWNRAKQELAENADVISLARMHLAE